MDRRTHHMTDSSPQRLDRKQAYAIDKHPPPMHAGSTRKVATRITDLQGWNAMSFTVTGLDAAGAVLVDCDTVVAALEETAQLLRSDYADVLIADDTGLQYTPAEFTHAFG